MKNIFKKPPFIIPKKAVAFWGPRRWE